MKLGFYYHITIYNENGCLKLPSYLGLFVDSIASQVEELVLFFHQAKPHERIECDYTLTSKNISWINLGTKNPAWYREIFHKIILNKHLKSFDKLDAFLIRSPTPFGPHIHKYIKKEKLFYLLVGHYGDGADNLKVRSLRDILIRLYLNQNNARFNRSLKGANILVNSNELLKRYRTVSKKVSLVRTTTLSCTDFYQRANTCDGEKIQLLYSGRIDPSKGLVELVKALKLLNDSDNGRFILTIVGWDTDLKQRNLMELQNLVTETGLSNIVKFEGKKKVGAELNKFYRDADIYVFPSYFEGFPRTIWEAMANSVPIITTAVGGIPYILEDGTSAIFCKSRSEISIYHSVIRLTSNRALRSEIIENSFRLAQENTLEKQSKLLVDSIKSQIKRC